MSATRTITRSAHESDSPTVEGRREAVLIVTTDLGRRDELISVVEGAGWLPLHAATSDEALQVLYEAPPDLLLLDVADASGAELEILEDYGADPDGVRVPVVCLLARRNRRLTIDAFARRADDVVHYLLHH